MDITDIGIYCCLWKITVSQKKTFVGNDLIVNEYLEF